MLATWGVRLDRKVAPCSRPTTNVIGPLHECKKVCSCTKPCPSQAFTHQASNSFEARSENEGDKRDIGQEADGKKGSPTKQSTLEGLEQGLPSYN